MKTPSCFFSLALLSAGLLSAELAAQTVSYVPSQIPSTTCPRPLMPGMVGMPESHRFQLLIPGTAVGTVARTISNVGLYSAQSVTVAREHITFERIVIRMATRAEPTLAAQFADNLTHQVATVLDDSNRRWHVERDAWNAIGLDNTYAFDPAEGNLVIDIEIHGGRLSSGVQSPIDPGGEFFTTHAIERLTATGWTTTPPAGGTIDMSGHDVMLVHDGGATTVNLGAACGTANAPSLVVDRAPVLGSTLNAELSGAPAQAATVLLIGAPATPVDLTALGATDCHLAVTPFASLDVVVNGSGAGSLALPIPQDPTLRGLTFQAQALVIDPAANTLGVALTGWSRLTLGN